MCRGSIYTMCNKEAFFMQKRLIFSVFSLFLINITVCCYLSIQFTHAGENACNSQVLHPDAVSVNVLCMTVMEFLCTKDIYFPCMPP